MLKIVRYSVVVGIVWVAASPWSTAAEPAKAGQPAANAGELPRSADGRPLNLDFERGTLEDWTAEGEAFQGQPIKGDIDPKRPLADGKHSLLQGNYWVGGFELKQDGPQGTLTSVPFKVTRPFAAFRVGGGKHAETCVELVRKDTGKVFFKSSGGDLEEMMPVVADLKPEMGKEIFIRLVDRRSDGWGHLNFDDFRFYETKPAFARPPDQAGPNDEYEFAGLAPDEAARAMKLPEGFSATAYAGEPDVRQPIAMVIDDRGRLWIAEAYSYPRRVPDAEAQDRILIFEDTDGDGKFDKRSIFAEKLNLVSGLELGFGGVWVGAAPQFLFIPDADGDDRADGPPQVLLDGWGYQDTHETLNSFIWGPDGWLYGCHGVFTHSNVGKPGTPDNERVSINAGIWRYHPTRHVFEVFCHGTSNPWGVDFNDFGQSFLTSCVIPHLYQVIQGARYERQGGQHFNPYTYDEIKTIADHRHYLGGQPHAGNNRSDEAGGGHAHAGAMVYLGGAWPEKYRNQIFMNNIHGQRINMDILKPHGSGYVGSHGPDFCLTNDRWSQILSLRYGPDGQVYMIDWYDKNACHHGDVNGHDRTNGRIFKITYGKAKSTAVDLSKLTDQQLAQQMLEANDFHVRHARRLLQERASKRAIDKAAVNTLRDMALKHVAETRRLRGMWALHAIGMLDGEAQGHLLGDASPQVRAWTIQLAGDAAPASADKAQAATDKSHLARLEQLAASDSSPVVRLYLASRVQRLPLADRWTVLAGLVKHAEDETDQNLPCMYWYALEPLVTVDMARALDLAQSSPISLLLRNTVRRAGAVGNDEALELIIKTLGAQQTAARQSTVLDAMTVAFAGRRQITAPPSWPAVQARLLTTSDPKVRGQLETLAVTFGDAAALAGLRTRLADAKVAPPQRIDALAALLKAKDPQLPPLLRGLLQDPTLRGPALRGLAASDDPATAAAIVEVYDSLPPADKRDALSTLCARISNAKVLLAAIADKRIAARDLSADLVRQLHALGDKELNAALDKAWGTVRDLPADKIKQIDQYKQLLADQGGPPADVNLGRAMFAKTCQQCHTLFGTGGKVGPELTGANRSDVGYLLSNILDPSAVMAKEYVTSIIATDDGRVITGIVKAQDDNSLTVQTQNELLTLARNDVDTITQSDKSMMPDDLLKPLASHEVRSLLAYLGSATQVPMLATADNSAGLFNGKDLSMWQGDEKLWSVDQGEIVGKTAGLAGNEFLKSELLLKDFRLTVEVKLVGNEGNSGIQFRSAALPNGEMQGYQADVGAGWWGKLYEESGRGLLWDKSGEEHVKLGDWNTYEIATQGHHIHTSINGKACVDLDDPQGAVQGILGLQLHAGGATEVRFRNFRLDIKQPEANK
jgi:putative membrane-bound dehydrogenase-like protein